MTIATQILAVIGALAIANGILRFVLRERRLARRVRAHGGMVDLTGTDVGDDGDDWFTHSPSLPPIRRDGDTIT